MQVGRQASGSAGGHPSGHQAVRQVCRQGQASGWTVRQLRMQVGRHTGGEADR